MHASELVPHPRVFIYRDAHFDLVVAHMRAALEESVESMRAWAFGAQIPGLAPGEALMRESNAWGICNVVFYRLLHQHPERVTNDAHSADLFIIPQVLEADALSNETEAKSKCDWLFNTHFESQYRFLNAATARRHLLCPIGTSIVFEVCYNQWLSTQNQWRRRQGPPVSLALLERMRVAMHEEMGIVEDFSNAAAQSAPLAYFSTSVMPGSATGVADVTMPFMSGAASSTRVLRAVAAALRRNLLSFAGSTHGNWDNPALRTRLVRTCRADHACVHIEPESERAIYRLKRRRCAV